MLKIFTSLGASCDALLLEDGADEANCSSVGLDGVWEALGGDPFFLEFDKFPVADDGGGVAGGAGR